jgi:peptidoglycan/xylan/chitin deacetylase (PgdA/CDA1 family)
MLPSHGRYEYSPITARRRFRWPGGQKLAVYFACGIEHYAFGEGLTENLVAGMPAPVVSATDVLAPDVLAPDVLAPDVLNHSWREYGNRVGAWRVLDLFARRDVPLAILLNSAVCEEAPALIAACRSQGCEMVAHGYSNSETLAGMAEQPQLEYLRRVSAQIAGATGRAPEGWAGPWLAETLLTPDLLQESGYSYLLDWCMDDQPVWMKTRAGRILSVPYTQELNDSSAIIGRQVDAQDFADMVVDQFDEMRETDDDQALVMSVVLHSFVIGQPFRLRALRRAVEHILKFRDEIWLTQPGAIARHFINLPLEPA